MQFTDKQRGIFQQSNHHAIAIITDVAMQLKLLRQLPDERTKADALNFAANTELYARGGICCH